MRLTRRDVVAGGAAAALGAAGIYELVDRLGGAPEQARVRTQRPEQHILEGVRVAREDGVEIVVPPVHHQVVTVRLRVEDRRAALREAQGELEARLATIASDHDPPPEGVALTLAWGLPYFRRYVPGLAERHLPVDRRASASKRGPVRALLDAIRFPSDPETTLLEANDLAVILSSDHSDSIAAASRSLFRDFDALQPTSIRKGFVGGGLPRRLAVAAGVRGAELIPDDAQLFLGFTSTQRAALGPPVIANLETLGYADLGPDGYFLHGTHMHVSHLFENVEAWYLNFDSRERVDTMFRPGIRVAEGVRAVRQATRDVQTADEVRRAFERTGRIGHSGAVQPASRLQEDVVGTDGVLYRKGTAVPQRVDFNTLDNPFFWTAHPERDGYSEDAAAGLHFVVFNPTSDDFHRTRLALDGVMPDGKRLPFERLSRGQGFNSVLATTHRQNFLVPPRRHRSFPLVELIR